MNLLFFILYNNKNKIIFIIIISNLSNIFIFEKYFILLLFDKLFIINKKIILIYSISFICKTELGNKPSSSNVLSFLSSYIL